MDQRHLNRELSLLDFQARVLALAEDPSCPLLERVNFVAIVSSNIDEFFQVKIAGIKEQAAAGVGARSPDGVTPPRQLAAIRTRIEALRARLDGLVSKELLPDLEAAGITLSDFKDLDAADRRVLDEIFEDQIFPVLTPLAVDTAHPFPFISNLSLNLAVQVADAGGPGRFARIKVPPILPRFVVLPDGERFVPLEQVIAAHLDRLFPRMQILGYYPFRVTRATDPTIDESEAPDLLQAIESALRLQQRSAPAVRLEVHPSISDDILDVLLAGLELGRDDVYFTDPPLDLSGLWALYELDRPDLKNQPWVATIPPRLASPAEPIDMFAEMRRSDLLVHLPYESFASSAGALLANAATDPDVLAIKQTLYRTSRPEDPALGGEETIVDSLIEAARSGKQVVVLVELKARFDEQANIRWARLLEKAGAHVAYGVVGLKTHGKILLVARREGSRVRRYSHIGSGNYNPKTARIYEDVGLFTADEKIGSDLSELFNVLTGFGRRHKYRRLWVAPTTLRAKLLKRIAQQAALGPEGSIVMKINHLTDPEMIEALYAASGKGVEIDLIVRSTCALIPGAPVLSETIRVRSLVGRFLEHSRIFRFGRPETTARYLIGSSDLMPRNLDGRVEVLAPVKDPVSRARLEEILQIELADDVLAWQLGRDGTWSKVPTRHHIDTHRVLQAKALERARGDS